MMIFAFLCIFDGFLNLLGCFLWKADQPQNFNKTAAYSHHCVLRHPAPSLGHWYTGIYLRIFDPGPNNPTTFLGLFSPGDYRQSMESAMGVPIFNSTEKTLTFTIYDCTHTHTHTHTYTNTHERTHAHALAHAHAHTHTHTHTHTSLYTPRRQCFY